MISRIAVRFRWLRRKLGRAHWSARLFGIRPPTGEADLPGLIMIQIDGLARTQFEKALSGGQLPFLSRLIRRQHFTVEDFYSGIPSTTPAVQGELFYGVRAAVPAFQFVHRSDGKIMRMYEASSAEVTAGELESQCQDPLLLGGRSYSNIYRAGAERSRYCSQDFAPDELLRRLHPLKTVVLSLIYLPRIVRMIGLAVLELVLAVVDLFRGLYQRQHFLDEIGFVPARVMVSIVLREMIRFRVLMDIERGVQTIHANFLGYDEQAHRRCQDSAFAHWTLKGIDRTIRDIYRASVRSTYRDYEVMVYSDHGQERTTPYDERFGRPLIEAVEEVFSRGPLAGAPVWMSRMPEMVGNSLERWRGLFGPGLVPAATPEADNIVLACLGPIGHLYFPRPLAQIELEAYARDLVNQAGVPLVMWRDAEGKTAALNARGLWRLPEDRREVIGEDHPFLDEAGADLSRLSHHPDAGDLVLSGWDPAQQPLTFRMENGAHAGPGREETRGFLLVPDRIRRWHVSHLSKTVRRVRPEDLRKIALHFLGRDGERQERIAEAETVFDATRPIRVMTYNIHSCIGLDGKVRPERVARVINHFDPDLVAVQEVDAHRLRSREDDQAQVIADSLRMNHAFHAMLEIEKEKYGIALFSRHPFQIVKSAYLTEAGKGRLREPRGAIWIRQEFPGLPPIHLVNTHFGLGREERSRQVEMLLSDEWLGGIDDSEPVILCGDFNSGPRSAVYKRLRSRFRDVQEIAPGHRPRPTFSSIRPLLRIDHIFISRHFQVERVELPETPSSVIASDHLPLCVELSLRPS